MAIKLSKLMNTAAVAALCAGTAWGAHAYANHEFTPEQIMNDPLYGDSYSMEEAEALAENYNNDGLKKSLDSAFEYFGL